MNTAAYGTWASPVTTDLVTSGTIGLSSPQLDADTLYWLEARPDQAGRVALVRQPHDGDREPVTVLARDPSGDTCLRSSSVSWLRGWMTRVNSTTFFTVGPGKVTRR